MWLCVCNHFQVLYACVIGLCDCVCNKFMCLCVCLCVWVCLGVWVRVLWLTNWGLDLISVLWPLISRTAMTIERERTTHISFPPSYSHFPSRTNHVPYRDCALTQASYTHTCTWAMCIHTLCILLDVILVIHHIRSHIIHVHVNMNHFVYNKYLLTHARLAKWYKSLPPPYRHQRQVLQPSLEGNSNISFIFCISQVRGVSDVIHISIVT